MFGEKSSKRFKLAILKKREEVNENFNSMGLWKVTMLDGP
jgi:hypothetical protein